MDGTANKTGEEREVRKEPRVQHAVINQAIGYIITALGLIAGLAWNDAMRSLIEHLFPLTSNSVFAKFTYAILLTLIVALTTLHLVKLEKRDEE